MSMDDGSRQPSSSRRPAKQGKPSPENSVDESSSIKKESEFPSAAEPVIIGRQKTLPKGRVASGDLLTQAKNPLTVAFLLALVGGLLAVFYAPGIGGMVFAVGAMVAYFIFGLLIPKTLRNTEQFADSLYYLGFILTLGALFLAMAPGFQSNQISSQDIIQKFGLAILTTFIGMSLRIILLQLRYTASDQEEEARESLASYAVSLQNEVESTITQIRQFRNDAVENAKKSASEFLLHLGTLNVPTDIFTARLKASADALSQEVDDLRGSISKGANSFTETLASSVNAATRLKADVDALEQLITSASGNLANMAKVAADNTRGFAVGAQDAGLSMQQFRQEAAALAGALQELQRRLNECGAVYKVDLVGATNQVRLAADGVTADAKAFSTELVTSAKLIRDALQDVRRNE